MLHVILRMINLVYGLLKGTLSNNTDDYSLGLRRLPSPQITKFVRSFVPYTVELRCTSFLCRTHSFSKTETDTPGSRRRGSGGGLKSKGSLSFLVLSSFFASLIERV